jgi:hypothetical protein
MAEARRTDPTGRCFLSYRRARLQEAELLLRAQHELGIPTWQDIENLDEVHTETELRRILRDPTTAGAVLWLTPEVADSPTIRKIEVPEILKREQAGDAFFFVPVAAGGLDYGAAAELVNDQLGVQDLSTWNMRRVSNDPANEADARNIAGRVLRRRIAAVHRELPEGQPFGLSLTTRHKPAFETGRALAIDWSHRFSFRSGHDGAWEALLPSLVTIRETLRGCAPGRALKASGSATLSAGLALGRTFLSLDRAFSLTWRQEAPDRPDQLWSLAAPREAAPVEITTVPIRPDGDALAVLLSLTANVGPTFSNSKRDLPLLRAAIEVGRPVDPFQAVVIETPGQAVDIVERTVEAVRRAREDFQTRTLHLFGAIPLGLAVLLGQRLNTLGPVQTYEHDEKANRYREEVLLSEVH